MKEKNLIPIYILEILNLYSSEDCKLTQKKIVYYLERDYDIKIHRNTLSKYIYELREEGYVAGDRGIYLKRIFSNDEYRFLINSVMYSKSLWIENINSIVEKLKSIASPKMRKQINNTYIINEINHSDNKNIYDVVEKIYSAIEKNKKIEITICNYDVNGNLRNRGKRVVSPYYVVFEKSRLYMICYSGRESIEPRRIDRISDVKILNEKRMEINKIEKYSNSTFDIADYIKEHIYLYSGESERLVMRIKKKNIGDMIDWFGKDYTIVEEDEDNVTVRLKANTNAVYFWAMQYGSIAEVLYPESLRKKMKEGLEEMMEKYNKSVEYM